MNQKAIIQKQKELIELWSFYATEVSTDDLIRIKKLESELSALEAEEDDYGDCTFCGRAHSGKCKCS